MRLFRALDGVLSLRARHSIFGGKSKRRWQALPKRASSSSKFEFLLPLWPANDAALRRSSALETTTFQQLGDFVFVDLIDPNYRKKKTGSDRFQYNRSR
jgi:hypothetical protein